MLSFSDFKERLADKLKDLLEYRGYDVDIRFQEVARTDGRYPGMAVFINSNTNRETIAPTFRLNDLYEDYLNGRDINDMVEKLAEISVRPAPSIKSNTISDVTNYETAKAKLFVKVSAFVNAEDSIMTDSPYKKFEDIVISYHVLVDDGSSGIAAARVTNQLLRMYGITAEELHRDAMANHQNLFPVKLKTAGDMMRELGMPEEICIAIDEDPHSMDFIVNEKGFGAAVSMFFPDVMKEVGERLGGSFYILPSSINDLAVIPSSPDINLPAVNEMIQRINSESVDISEFLSDNAFHYDADARKLELATKYVERVKQQDAPNKGIDPRA